MSMPKERALAVPADAEFDALRLGEVMARSGFFADTRDAAQAVVKILAGRELGFGPVASMVGVYIVKGKVSLSANLIGAAVKRSGRYNYRVRDLTETACTIEFFEGKESVGVSTFTLEDAKTAGLLANQTWKQYPRNMLFARAMSNGARWYVPDVFGGPIYTPEELGAPVDAEGDIVRPALAAVAPAAIPRTAIAPPAPASEAPSADNDRVRLRDEARAVFDALEAAGVEAAPPAKTTTAVLTAWLAEWRPRLERVRALDAKKAALEESLARARAEGGDTDRDAVDIWEEIKRQPPAGPDPQTGELPGPRWATNAELNAEVNQVVDQLLTLPEGDTRRRFVLPANAATDDEVRRWIVSKQGLIQARQPAR